MSARRLLNTALSGASTWREDADSLASAVGDSWLGKLRAHQTLCVVYRRLFKTAFLSSSELHRGSMPVPLTVARCQHCRLSLLAQHGCTVSIHRQPARRRMLAARRFRHRRRDRTARHVLSSHPALRSPRAERGVADTLSALTALKPSPSQRLLGGGHAARRRLPPAIWPIASAWLLRSTWLTAELSLHCRLCAHRRLSTAARLLC